MSDHTYKVIELVGSSKTSVEDAIQKAIARASKSLRNLDWFEIVQVRGCVDKKKVSSYQVILKVGFKIES